jgi:recombination associated protein RdgC
MWFKNLVVYRLPKDWSWSSKDLEDQLWGRKLRNCSALEMFNRGWVPPSPDDQRLVYTINRHHLIALGINQKLLPSSIIRQETQERAKELAKKQGHAVARRQVREIKENVTTELRARALTRRKVMRAWIDPDNGWLVVDSASVPRAEELVEALRDTLGSFAVTLMDTERSAHVSMGAWLTHGDAPLRFSIDQDLELQAADKTKATVRYQRHPLEAKEIKAHLSAGKFVTRLGLTWNDRLAFVLTDKLQIKRIEFLEMARDEQPVTAETEDEFSADEKFSTDFVLMTGELGQLLKDVFEVLGGAGENRAAA